MYIGSLVEAISGNSNLKPGSATAAMDKMKQRIQKIAPDASITRRPVDASQIHPYVREKLGLK